MTTAAEWLALDSTSRQGLVTVGNIREKLPDWTRVGATTAYSATWASQTHPGQAKSAYRAITGVMINATALTERASLAAVQANASSWFWDSAASTLYISSASGASPATFTWVGALFSLYFSTEAVADSVLYEPRVTGSLPTIRSEEYDLTLGASSTSAGTLTLINGDGFFDDTSCRYAWHNATVDIAIGGGGMAVADFIQMGRLQVSGQPSPSDIECAFALSVFDDQARNRAFPLNVCTDFSPFRALIDPDFLGRFMPMFWGSVRDIPTVHLYNTVGALFTTIGWFLFLDVILDDAGTVSECRAKDRTTGVITTVPAASWGVIDGLLWVRFDDLAGFDAYDFFVDAARSNAGTAGVVVPEILSLVGVPAAAIDTAAFAAADVAWPATIALYVPGGAAPEVFVSCRELIRQIEQSCLGRVYVGADGRWTIDLYDPSVPTSAPEILEELMTTFEPAGSIQEAMALSVRVQYAHKVTDGAWSTVTASEAENGYQFQTTEVLNHSTILTEEHYATLLAGRLAWINSLPTTRVVIDGPPSLLALKPRDKVRVIRHRAPGVTGAWSSPGVGMEVEAISKRSSDCRAAVTVGNMRGIGGAVKIAAPNGTSDWASASSLERLLYGFGLDNTTQRADVADASTFKQFRAW